MDPSDLVGEGEEEMDMEGEVAVAVVEPREGGPGALEAVIAGVVEKVAVGVFTAAVQAEVKEMLPALGATFCGLSTASFIMGTCAVLVARRTWNWGRVLRERRRVRRMSAQLDAQLSQVVVEAVVATGKDGEVLPDSGHPVKTVKRTPPIHLRTPPRSKINRRLSDAWRERDIVAVNMRPRKTDLGRHRMKTRSQSSLESVDSFKSMD